MKKYQFLILLLVILASCLQLSFAQVVDYNDVDSIRVRNFLDLTADGGVKNGVKINSAYDHDNPATWIGWDAVENDWVGFIFDGMGNLVSFVANGKDLIGSLNLSDCQSLVTIDCNNNLIDSMLLENCPSLYVLNCTKNALKTIKLKNTNNLRNLNCDSNYIDKLDLSNCLLLQSVKTAYNNLTFKELTLPVGVTPLNEWNFDVQRPFIPYNVSNKPYRSSSLDVNIANHLPETDVVSTVLWYRGNIDANGDGIYNYYPITPPTRANGTSIFKFDRGTTLGRNVYCTITNPAHSDLVERSVVFTLRYRYNPNDSMRIRNFLDQMVALPDLTNGRLLVEYYNPEDPGTYGVTWEIKTIAGVTEWFVTSINWDEIGLVGKLNLTGTQFLTDLRIPNNNISEFVYESSSIIEYMDVSDNQIPVLDITKHPELRHLECHNNLLTGLDASNSTKLQYLDCSGNNLNYNGLNVNNLLALIELYCNDNELTHIMGLETLINLEFFSCSNNLFEVLNVKPLYKLTDFRADYNKLSTLHLEFNNVLNYVSVAYNKLDTFTLKGLSVEKLICHNNKLNFNTLVLPKKANVYSSIEMYPQDTIAREKFNIIENEDGSFEYTTKSNEIDISEYIYEFPNSTGITNFVWKNIYGDVIYTAINDGYLAIEDNFENQILYCEVTNSEFDNLKLVTPRFVANYQYNENDVNNIRTFLDLYCKYGNEDNGRTNGKEMSPLYNRNNPASYPGVIWSIANGERRAYSINWSYYPTLKGDLDLTGCSELVGLYTSCDDNLSRNDISKLILKDCNKLAEVFAYFNQLSELDIENCGNLYILYCNDNVITNDIYISAPYINVIDLSNNKINSITGLDNLKNVEYINVSYNYLKTISTQGSNNLVYLNCSNNQLQEVNVNSNVALRELNVAHNKLEELILANNSKLSVLTCNNNQLAALDLKNNIELVGINAAFNKLEKLDVKDKYITQLIANDNKLYFSHSQFDKLPNVFNMHPQAEIMPLGINESNVLVGDKIDVSMNTERDDYSTNYTLRYLDGTLVSAGLYAAANGVFSNFSTELRGKTTYIEATNPKFPGVTLRSIGFNVFPPMKYNENDVMRLRAIYDRQSKTAGVTNGSYISVALSQPMYKSEEPVTFPAVVWKAFDDEYCLVKVNWGGLTKLAGAADFTNCSKLQDVAITGASGHEYNGINTFVTAGCTNLESVNVSWNNLERVIFNNLSKLTKVNVSYNNIAQLAISNSYNIVELNCANNNLWFSTTNLEYAPNEFSWMPQSTVVPDELTTDNNGYTLRLRDDISLQKFGGINPTYHWFNINGDPIWVNYVGNGGFIIPKELDKSTIYCIILETSGNLDMQHIQTVRFLVDLTIGIDDETISDINIYPNPANDFAVINITNEGLNLDVQLFNTTGNNIGSIYSGEWIKELNIDTHNWVSGNYYLQITVDGINSIIPLTITK